MSVSGYRQLEYPLIIDLKHPREHTHVVTHIRPNILLTHKQSFQVLSWNITGTHIGSGRSETASNSYAQGSLIPGANYSAQDDHSGVQVYLFLCAYSSPGIAFYQNLVATGGEARCMFIVIGCGMVRSNLKRVVKGRNSQRVVK